MDKQRGMRSCPAGEADPVPTPAERAEADRLAKVIAIRDALSRQAYDFDGLLAEMFSGGTSGGEGIEFPALVDSSDDGDPVAVA